VFEIQVLQRALRQLAPRGDVDSPQGSLSAPLGRVVGEVGDLDEDLAVGGLAHLALLEGERLQRVGEESASAGRGQLAAAGSLWPANEVRGRRGQGRMRGR